MRTCHHRPVTTRALSFGSVAADYEQFRLGYPDELVDDVLAYAGQPIRTAIEIGAGTGKATRVFARRGIAVTATEPDAAMLAELRRHVPSQVTAIHSGFEELALTTRFDLVFAAASLHWTEPAGRWSRVAGLLEPGGIFASFGAPLRLADTDLEQAVRAARAPDLEDDDIPSPDTDTDTDATPPESDLQWPGTELERSELFADVRQVRIERRVTTSADEYVGLLGTISAYLELPRSVREQVLGRIRAVLPDRVERVGDLTLHLARLR